MKKKKQPGQVTPHKTASSVKKKIKRNHLVFRSSIQLFFYFMMPGAFFAGFSGIRYVFEQVGKQEPLACNNFVLTTVCLCIFTILFGRFFCGYICAFGSLGDLIYALSGLFQKKVLKRKKQIRIPQKELRFLQKIKYAVLAVIVVLCGMGLYSVISGYDPWTVFSFLTAFRFSFEGYQAGAVLLILIICGMAFQERFFCQILCPLGAVFSLLPVLPFSFLQRNPDQCAKGCSACLKNCPSNIKLENDGFLNGECIDCEKCIFVCPKNNLDRWDLKLFRNTGISALIRAVLFYIMGTLIGLCRFF